MNGPRRLLVASLLLLLIVLIVKAQIGTIWVGPRAGVDLRIPLLATERWQAGGVVYDPSAFVAGPGATQPFLYPPFVLPFLSLLTGLPRSAVLWTWIGILFVAAVYTVRRLRIPWLWVPLVIAWPPFTEGIVDGNIAILMFLAFVVLFYRAAGSPWRPEPRDVSQPEESPVELGALATVIGAVKISQPHAWLFVLHYRWRAAVIGAVGMAVFVLATLPFTGIDLWFDWLDQVRRAGYATWDLGGFAIPRFLPTPALGLVVAVVCAIAVWFVPRRDGGPWVGVLSTVGQSVAAHLRVAVPRAGDAGDPVRARDHLRLLHRDLLVRGLLGGDPGRVDRLRRALLHAERAGPGLAGRCAVFLAGPGGRPGCLVTERTIRNWCFDAPKVIGGLGRPGHTSIARLSARLAP